MLTCLELTELVTDYLERKMPLLERLRFEMHVGMCKHCRAYLRQMRMTVKTLGALPKEPIPEKTRDELLARLRDMPARKAAAPWHVGALAAIERAVGARRAWPAIGLTLLAMVATLFASGVQAGSLGDGLRCIATEIGSALVPLVLLTMLVVGNRYRFSTGLYAVAAMAGALPAYVSLHFSCGLSQVFAHAMAFHVGGVAAAALVGAAVSRVPAFR